jgi:hypothetical protein
VADVVPATLRGYGPGDSDALHAATHGFAVPEAENASAGTGERLIHVVVSGQRVAEPESEVPVAIRDAGLTTPLSGGP